MAILFEDQMKVSVIETQAGDEITEEVKCGHCGENHCPLLSWGSVEGPGAAEAGSEGGNESR